MRGQWRVALLAVAMIASMSVPPADAHTRTKPDGNDTPSKLDIRSASVGHKGDRVVHTIRTYESWKARILTHGRLLVGIDKNFDRRFELCAVIYYSGGLKGALTNCLHDVIRRLPVSKPSGSAARISIPVANTGRLYRWLAFSQFLGPGPCSNECYDYAPNRPPPLLHDLKPPVVGMTGSSLLVWRVSADTTFSFPFSVTDSPGVGVKSWAVAAQPLEGGSWTTVATGLGGGSKDPSFPGVEGTRTRYRVTAVDKQGNVAVKTRNVHVPWDDDNLGLAGSFSGGSPVPDPEAFGGSYQALAPGDTFTYEFPDHGDECRRFYLIGPGDGDWVVDLSGSVINSQIPAWNVPDGPRITFFSDFYCGDSASLLITVVSGSGFGLDALSA